MDEAFTTTITLDIEGLKGLTFLGEVIRRLEQHNNNFLLEKDVIWEEEAFYLFLLDWTLRGFKDVLCLGKSSIYLKSIIMRFVGEG